MKRKRMLFLLFLAMLVLAMLCLIKGFLPKAEKYSIEGSEYKCAGYASMSAEEIVASLSLEQKAAQMVMPAIYNISPEKRRRRGYHRRYPCQSWGDHCINSIIISADPSARELC